MRLVVVDNHDSFTFNLVDLFERLGAQCRVLTNDGCSADEIVRASADGFVISPGPCSPDEAGVTLDVVRAALDGRLARPLLGVCLGHQAIARALGARVVRAPRPLHGRVDRVFHTGAGLFEGQPQPLLAARYNSLVVERASLADELEVTAWSDRDEVMALRHRTLPVEGVQFHPESFLSGTGPTLVRRWLTSVAAARPDRPAPILPG